MKTKENHTTHDRWPKLNFNDYKDTLATFHLWSQIVGKIRLKKMPWTNHSWHVSLYISSSGLSTGSIPYKDGIFSIDFDLVDHQLKINSSTGEHRMMALYPRTIAGFYGELFEKLAEMDIDVAIHAAPNEIEPAIPFKDDIQPRSYEQAKAHDLWLAMVNIHNVFTQFRAGFVGKSSPVHLFWGSFDLAVTRFSGRQAPEYQGGPPNIPLKVMQEAYSHEVSSCGFWPGSDNYPHPAFYAYCYPAPADFKQQPVEPEEAFYSEEMGEFVLLYENIRQSPHPEEMLMKFLQTTYEAAANTAGWDRKTLEFRFSAFENPDEK